jgi:hypothetical protein
MSDNEDTSPPLRDGTFVVFHSDILSVQRAVGPPIPEFFQPPEEGSKCPSSVRRKEAGDVFVDEPTRPQDTSQLKEGKSEVSSGTFNACAEARDREVLAGATSDEEVDGRGTMHLMVRVEHGGEVAIVGDVGEPLLEHGARVRLDFSEPRRLETERLPRDRCCLDARANASVPHAVLPPAVSPLALVTYLNGACLSSLPRLEYASE